jgi:D-alanyl-D-alanine dipeptidase
MKALIWLSVLLFPALARAEDRVTQAGQLLLVTTPDWNESSGTAQRYERSGPAGGGWRPVGAPFPVTVGRAGLAWRADRGAPPPPSAEAPIKREGDGRAPAGILDLGEMWGYAAQAPAGVRLPYHQARPEDRCVDDPASPAYNQLTVEPPAGPPWRSAEVMRRPDDLYRYLLVVRYNMAAPLPGAGSCIFLHLWRRPGEPTAGCTAMSEPSLLALARWLDPRRRPVLVQLPAAQRAALRASWGLP